VLEVPEAKKALLFVRQLIAQLRAADNDAAIASAESAMASLNGWY